MGQASREAINVSTTTLLYELLKALQRKGVLSFGEIDAVMAASRESQQGVSRAEAEAFLDHIWSDLVQVRSPDVAVAPAQEA